MTDIDILEPQDWSFPIPIAYRPDLLDEIDIPRSLSEISVPKGCEERIARKALLDSAARTNPRAASLAEMRLLIKTSLNKAR